MTYSIAELKKEYDSIAIDEATPEIKNAIEKLKAESAENAVDLIRMMLVLTLVNGDNQLAEKIYSSRYKSLSLCFSHIKDWAKKKAIQGCAAIDHEDVLSEAIHYYVDIEDTAPTAPKNTAFSKSNNTPHQTVPILPNLSVTHRKQPTTSQKAAEENKLISLF